jgi:hypothetical protein
MRSAESGRLFQERFDQDGGSVLQPDCAGWSPSRFIAAGRGCLEVSFSRRARQDWFQAQQKKIVIHPAHAGLIQFASMMQDGTSLSKR